MGLEDYHWPLHRFCRNVWHMSETIFLKESFIAVCTWPSKKAYCIWTERNFKTFCQFKYAFECLNLYLPNTRVLIVPLQDLSLDWNGDLTPHSNPWISSLDLKAAQRLWGGGEFWWSKEEMSMSHEWKCFRAPIPLGTLGSSPVGVTFQQALVAVAKGEETGNPLMCALFCGFNAATHCIYIPFLKKNLLTVSNTFNNKQNG